VNNDLPGLDRPAVYEVKVPGRLDAGWRDWLGDLDITHGTAAGNIQVTILTGELDQAALLGLMRRLYNSGLPIISVRFLETGGHRGE